MKIEDRNESYRTRKRRHGTRHGLPCACERSKEMSEVRAAYSLMREVERVLSFLHGRVKSPEL